MSNEFKKYAVVLSSIIDTLTTGTGALDFRCPFCYNTFIDTKESN